MRYNLNLYFVLFSLQIIILFWEIDFLFSFSISVGLWLFRQGWNNLTERSGGTIQKDQSLTKSINEFARLFI